MSQRVLIAGAGGYIGSKMVQSFLDHGHEIIALDRYYFGGVFDNLRNNKKLQIVKNDVRTINNNILKGVDVVINLAAISNDPSSELNPQVTQDINHKGAVHLAVLAKKHNIKKYILSSSCSVYGSGDSTLDETSTLAPISEYAKSKIAAEKDILKLATDDFCVTTLRLATVYGLSEKRMRFDLIVNIMSLYAWRDKKIFILGGGKQWRPLVHIDDVIQAFELVMNEESLLKIQKQVFNVGSNEQNYQVFQVANLLTKYFPELEIVTTPDDPDKRNYHVNFDKIHKTLKFKESMKIEQGIQEIKNALEQGLVKDDLRTVTLKYYQYLIEADKILSEVKLNGKLF